MRGVLVIAVVALLQAQAGGFTEGRSCERGGREPRVRAGELAREMAAGMRRGIEARSFLAGLPQATPTPPLPDESSGAAEELGVDR